MYMYVCMHISPEMPEKEVTNGFVLQGPTEKEFPELTVEVGLKLEHLYQLKKIHRQHLITAVHFMAANNFILLILNMYVQVYNDALSLC